MSDLKEFFGPKAVIGKGDIAAEVLADSVNTWGDRFVTFRWHYPRFFHAEVMTHKMLSKNYSSSRAIPVERMIKQVRENPAMPVFWGKKEKGMQAWGEVDNIRGCEDTWLKASLDMLEAVTRLNIRNLHKQITNRLIEPWQFMNGVVSATDWENFFWLRNDPMAQPEIQELAQVTLEAYNNSEPEHLLFEEWHTPYVEHRRDDNGRLVYLANKEVIDKEKAKKVSASCAAQASYRRLNTTVEKAVDLYDKLVGAEKKHASPFEHVAMPHSYPEFHARKAAKETLFIALEPIYGNDIAHEMSLIAMYCGNVQGWTQVRKLIPGENKRGKKLDVPPRIG